MIQSMTGFGQSSCELEDKIVNIEIKSLNSKQLDLYIRIPSIYRDKEMDLRNELNGKLKRGKIDVTFYLEYNEEKLPVQINAGIVRNYYEQLKDILDKLGLKADESLMQAILRMPESVSNEKQVVDPSEWRMVLETVLQAAESLDEFRKLEGESIANDLALRIGLIESNLELIEPYEYERIELLKSKLQKALAEAVQPDRIDQNRFEQELIYYLEKFDITEEKTRLIQHCNYFCEVMNESEQAGRKLIFIAQEIGREINTIGSKASHAGIQKLVVLMKDELEKIKEQLLNVL